MAYCRLKSSYHAFKEMLGQTGHGLVVAGLETELHEGSDAANIWVNLFVFRVCCSC
jgi:hypothetical protein